MKRIFFLTAHFALFLIFALNAFAQTEITISPQPNSPLQISDIDSKWRVSTDDKEHQWNMLSVEFAVQNIGNKAVRAYTICIVEDRGLGGSAFSYPTSVLFEPKQTRQNGLGEYGYLKTPESIKLVVDFVEFADGTTWGEDSSESAQQLIGLRAGAEMLLDYLKNINKQDGIEAVIKALDATKDTVPLPENQNYIWQRGFRTGISVITVRFKKIYEKQGIKALEKELQKPFDPPSEK